MNIKETRGITVSGVYEDDMTFGRLCVNAIVEYLTDYGFETSGTSDRVTVSWNGKPRFVIAAKSSTSMASVRVAGPYDGGGLDWGTTYELFSINSASVGTQTGDFSINFFAIGDVAYFDINNYVMAASIPCRTIDGTESAVFIKEGFSSVVPLFAETISNDASGKWSIGLPVPLAHPEDAAMCVVVMGGSIYQKAIVKGFSESIMSFKTKTTVDIGQVFTINGMTAVCFLTGYCVRVS